MDSSKLKTYLIAGISVICLVTLYMLTSNTIPTPVNIADQLNQPSDINKYTSIDENNSDVLYQSFSKHQNICTSDSFNEGKWIHQSVGLDSYTVDGINSYSGYHCNWDFPHRCYRRDSPAEFNRSKAIIDYSWQPNDCMVFPFEATKFSRHLSQNPLLLVGDSITQLMFESLWCLLGQDMVSQDKDTGLSGGDTTMWISQLVHKDIKEAGDIATDKPPEASIAYIRSDYLVKLDDFSLIKPNEGEGYQIGVGNNFPWVQALPRFRYIMINTGPHWHPDLKWGPNRNRAELLTAFKKAMRKVYNYLKNHIRDDQIVWVRSTPYGHANCSQYTAPSDHIIKPMGRKKEYEWDMFESFDFAWKEMIEKENDPRFQFFNVTLSNYRGDAHSSPDNDCLHTCLPGPVDDWNKLLFHEVTKLVVEKYENS
ncbi:GDSL/SGNH-like acyl-esterase family found in Pmr5 and Cas1p-domain-containing protein [Mycotypha africana]|uniref:GDSL/SGNH-like acyl-esterase family found in Pmr5 and Cas1p-domain-containing protein n=1 Tax=Mycotypha africana TaxID=64632 RepID=UPI00230113EC|nr:GDSL/SGNH-like acyl-esterase family found in Pmr5 and Cas1p-domain-containing protein [Mycotypha africana]KAI8970384.1 GDSL/SGNH-like acyl-esterase family found in Pmr5 and Cas1p-domain-containing protein [Mycotypha africana]